LQLQLFGEPVTPASPRESGTRRRPGSKRAQVEVSLVEAGTTVVPLPPEPSAAVVAALTPAFVPPVHRILIFDVETTGTDKKRDQIIELCVQCGLEDDAPSRTWRFRPSVSINPGAQAVHGIGIEDLADCPAFEQCADEVAAVFAGSEVVIGYNLAFDIDMLHAEYERCGRTPLDFSGKTIVDAFRLWQQCEPRSLQHAHRRFVGDGFAAAHSASADVAATGRVLRGMLNAFELADRDWGAIAIVCDPTRSSWVGPSRHLRWDGESIVFGFGKHAGTQVTVLAREAPDYLEWLINKDFPDHVGEICRAALQHRDPVILVAWVRDRFGQPAPTEKPPFVTAEETRTQP
jgi:DNA polymerase-3 subunit epsilon